MANFINCWNQLKAKGYKHANGEEVLDKNDRASIEALIKDHTALGVPHEEAARAAIQTHLDEAHAQLQSVYDQVKPAPVSQPTETPAAPPTETGASSKRFTEAYGDSAPVANTGKGPAAWADEGLSRLDNYQKTGDVKNDPYAVLTNLREGRTPISQYPSDVALIGAEHQRLLEAARQAEGTPEYEAKSQAALNMAEAIKEVAHGPAGDTMRALQDHNKPRYDNVTDFDQALRERENRESTPEEKTAFKKMSEDVTSTKDAAAKEIDSAQKKLDKFPKMAFEDAATNIQDQIAKLTKLCQP